MIDLDGERNRAARRREDGGTPLILSHTFEVGRPPGLRPGTAIPWPFVFNFVGVPLPPGGHFEWRLSINGDTREEWRLPILHSPGAAASRGCVGFVVP